MAIAICEFEFFPVESGTIVAMPCNDTVGGATTGANLADAVECAADYLKTFAETLLMRGDPVPEGPFGHTPRHPDGRVIAVAVEATLDDIRAVTAVQAATMLGVSTARVAQMCSTQKLESWKDGSRRMVTVDSIHARMEERPRAGRPKGTTKASKKRDAPAAAAL